MRSYCRRIVAGSAAFLLVVSGASGPTFARDKHRDHDRRSRPVAGSGEAGAPAAPGARGLYAGAGGIYSPNYEMPGGDVYHLGGQILGGSFGKAYEDYYRHYYYYKYAYCPLGTGYVIYLRRCVGPGDLFR